MGGISSLLKTFFDLLHAGGFDLSGRQRIGAVLILVVALAPSLVRSMMVSHTRNRVLQTRTLDGLARQEAEATALREAEGKPRHLVSVAEAALTLGREALAHSAVAALARTGEEREALRSLKRRLTPKVALPATPEEALIVAERLLEAGMEEEAARRLELARSRWPDLPDAATLKVTIGKG